LLLGRTGRYWNPPVDKAALDSWLAQYKIHAVWLEDRIDPDWAKKIERRPTRRKFFRLVLYALFIGMMLIQSLALLVVGFIAGDAQFWALMIGVPLVAFFLWIFMRLVREILKHLAPGWTGFAGIAPLERVRAFWAGRIRTIWQRSKTKRLGDTG
jgi:hypothetical protein